jgi:beta-glucosidase
MLGSYTLWAPEFQAIETVQSALQRAAPASTITYAAGASAEGPPGSGSSDIPAAVALATASDLVVMVVGDDVNTCGEWVDRSSLDMPGGQQQLLEAVAATGVPLIVILLNGRTVTFGADGSATPNAVLGSIDALLEAWRPGQMGAQALVDIITGAVSPSGKLAQNWVRAVGQVNSGASPWLAEIRGKWVANAVGTPDQDGRIYDPYIAVDSTPLFRLGCGLSYTTFEYTSLSVNTQPQPGATMSVTVTLRNTGTTAASEIVQVTTKQVRLQNKSRKTDQRNGQTDKLRTGK